MGQQDRYLNRLAEVEGIDLGELTDLGLTNLWMELDVLAWQVQRKAIEGAEGIISTAIRLQQAVEQEQEVRGQLGFRSD